MPTAPTADWMRDVVAEQAVIGSILLRPNSLGEILQVLVDGSEFTVPGYGDAFAAAARLWRSGKPIDVVTLMDAMSGRTSSQDLLLEAMNATPSVSGGPGYARIVAARHTRRRLHSAGVEITEVARRAAPTDDVGALIDAAREAVGAVEAPAGATVRDLSTVSAFLASAGEERPEWVIPGLLRRRHRALFVAPEGTGKRLRVDEPIPTPSGWTTMGELQPGDVVFNRHGVPCNVTAVSPVEPTPDAYTVRFHDGTEIEADAEHLWLTWDYAARQTDYAERGPRTRTTSEIARTLRARGGHCLNHAVPVAGPLDCPEADLPIDPYLLGAWLGAWLGDGTSRAGMITVATRDADILDRLGDHHVVPSSATDSCVGVTVDGLAAKLRAAGLLCNKHVPAAYLRASISQRLALLAGLMDTDGYIAAPGSSAGKCEITLTSEVLASGVADLIRTVGLRCSVSESDAVIAGRVVGRRWRITFTASFNPFRTTWKASRWEPLRTQRSQWRYIESVTPCPPTPMRCIAVDSPDHTYLASRQLVPTHNTVILRQMAMCASQGVQPFWTSRRFNPVRVLIVDCENPADHLELTLSALDAKLRRLKGAEFLDDSCYLMRRDNGLHLRTRSGRAELEAAVSAVRPDLVAIGPAYKLGRARGDRDATAAADEAMEALDDLRVRYDFALLLETHAPKGDGKERNLTPGGTMHWMAWPEFGLQLVPDGDGVFRLGRFRADRIPAAWPDHVLRGPADLGGTSMPWTGRWDAGFDAALGRVAA